MKSSNEIDSKCGNVQVKQDGQSFDLTKIHWIFLEFSWIFKQ